MSIIIAVAIILLAIISYAYWFLVLKDKNSNKLIKGGRERLENKIFNYTELINSDPDAFFDSTQLILQFKNNSINWDNLNSRNDSFYLNLGLEPDKIAVNPHSVCLLMPFNSRFNSRFEVIRETCATNGFDCRRSDQTYATGNLLRQIVEMILGSQLIIALLDGKNPNVFYEIGLAHSLGKPVILIVNMQDKNEMPFDISSDRLLLYSSMNDLKDKLDKTLRHISHA